MKLPSEKGIWDIWKIYESDCRCDKHIPTKNGMCIALDIQRSTYNIWKKKSNTLKRVEGLIEEYWVQTLRANNVAGSIFYLKNAFGYRDRQDLDMTTKGKEINFTDDQKNKVAQEILNRNNDTKKNPVE